MKNMFVSEHNTETFHYIDNKIISEQAIFLYHGTGGDEYDLIPLVAQFEKNHRIVSLRGNRQEHGMNRFFDRFPNGTFNLESITEETEKLARFIEQWSTKNDIPIQNICHLGYSNGANFLITLLCRRPELIGSAGLLHGMLHQNFMLEETKKTNYANNQINFSQMNAFVSWSKHDPIIPDSLSIALQQFLKYHGAQVTIHESTAGHRIDTTEQTALTTWITELTNT